MKMIRTGSAITAAALASAFLLLAGCHSKAEQAPQNSPVEEVAPPPALPTAPPPPPPQPKAAPAKVETPPPDTASLSEEEQIREDAVATGMTSRVQRGNNGAEAAAVNSDQE